jgi:hypothetical protein
VESEFLCTDGTGSPTGTTRTVNQVLIGDCNPPPTTCVTTAPVDLVFAVDASGSMSSLVASTRAALASITNGILAGHNNVRMTVTAIGGDGYTPDPSSPIDSVDLGSYFPGFPSTIISDTCTVGKLYGPGGPSAAGVDAGFANLTSNHGTALGAGVTFAGQFLSPSTRKSAMIVLSDGFQGCTPDFNYLGAIQVQISRGVKMYGIAYNAPGVGYDPNYFSLFHSYAVADNPQTIYDAISQFVNQTVVTTCAPPCQGTMVGGFCWYMGQERKSCDEVCASHGGCNTAGTVSYAGSAGSDVQCSAVLGALGQPSTLQSVAAHQSPGVNANYAAMTGVGCSLMKNTVVTLVSPTTETYPTRVTTSNMLSTPTVHPTTCGANYEYAVMSGPSSADYYGARRACSCNN